MRRWDDFMTATQIYLRFLKEELTMREYQFFMHFMYNHGNRYFRNRMFDRKLFHETFVEDYLSRNNRPLCSFMKRMFILAPNLKRRMRMNPRHTMIVREWKTTHDLTKKYKTKWGRVQQNRFKFEYLTGMYVNYYNRKWYAFLEKWVDKETSPSIYEWFRKDKKLEFNLKSVLDV